MRSTMRRYRHKIRSRAGHWRLRAVAMFARIAVEAWGMGWNWRQRRASGTQRWEPLEAQRRQLMVFLWLAARRAPYRDGFAA